MPLSHFFNLLQNVNKIENDNCIRLAVAVAKILFGEQEPGEEEENRSAGAAQESPGAAPQKIKVVQGVAYPKTPEDTRFLIASLGLR